MAGGLSYLQVKSPVGGCAEWGKEEQQQGIAPFAGAGPISSAVQTPHRGAGARISSTEGTGTGSSHAFTLTFQLLWANALEKQGDLHG